MLSNAHCAVTQQWLSHMYLSACDVPAGSVDGLVEASRQSRVCGGAANEIMCAIFRVLMEVSHLTRSLATICLACDFCYISKWRCDCNVVCQSQNGFADMLAAGSYILHSLLFAPLHQLATANVINLQQTVLCIHRQQFGLNRHSKQAVESTELNCLFAVSIWTKSKVSTLHVE